MTDDVINSADLVASLEAAIARKEALARAATPGPWTSFPPGDIAEWAIYGDGWTIADTRHFPREDMVNAATELRKPATVVEHGNANAEHIANNDPTSVLAMCEAHRQVVATYAEYVKVGHGIYLEGAMATSAAEFEHARLACLVLRPVISALATYYRLGDTQETT